ncbi:DUF924 family protein [Morganella psychrotolerans]|uniref:DUF924 family protein n=1 Tax=Morganella psychrotolerans TaxID=368603 RepID=UPI0039AFE642
MEAQDILNFWFNEITPEQWFKKDTRFDTQIRSRFLTVWEQAAAGECFGWREHIGGRLAEIIVLDQFSRNLFRDNAQAFSQDTMALVLAQEAVKTPDYLQLPPVQRKFVLMPYMHSESALIHKQAVLLFKGLDENTEDYERQHKAIIDRFGRYPHRNEILGRKSTPEECEFLRQPGSAF